MSPLLIYTVIALFVITMLCVLTAMAYILTGDRKHKAVQALACITIAAAGANLVGLIKVILITF